MVGKFSLDNAGRRSRWLASLPGCGEEGRGVFFGPVVSVAQALSTTGYMLPTLRVEGPSGGERSLGSPGAAPHP